MLPRFGTSKLCDTWIVVLLGASILAWLDGGFTAGWLSLSPDRVVHGEVWRVATWPLIEHSPLQLILTCAAIYKFGSELAIRWGDRRLRRRCTRARCCSASSRAAGNSRLGRARVHPDPSRP